MNKYLSVIVASLFFVNFGAFGMDLFDSTDIGDAGPKLSFWLQTKSDQGIFCELTSDMAQSMERVRDKINKNKNKMSYDCSQRELQVFYTYACGRQEVRNGIAEKGQAVIRNVDKIEDKHKGFLLDLPSNELACLTVMVKHFYKEDFAADLYDPWKKIIDTNLSQGIGRGDFFESLFLGHEDQGNHIFSFCSAASGANDQLNISVLEKSGLLQSQNPAVLSGKGLSKDQNLSDDEAVITSFSKNDQPEIKPTALTRLTEFIAPYKNYIFGALGICMGAALLRIMILQHKITSLR